MIKVATIVGARPQFIKASVVSKAFRENEGVEEILVHTGQHYDEQMSEVFYRELDIPAPAYDLGIGSAPHGEQTGRMLPAIESVLVSEAPDWVVVYGDTNSTLAGALAAAKLPCRLAHVEAGLRSFNRAMPEEVNRVVADHCSDLLFTPTELARANLRREGIAEEAIRWVGDVMYDAALCFGERAAATSRVLGEMGLEPGGFVLATVHRAENTDDPARLAAIFEGLGRVARSRPVVVPLHPRTRAALDRLDPSTRDSRSAIRFLEPVGYLDMLALERAAALVVTDSGGVQKEAFFQRTPCVTIRTETEWQELVEIGWNRLAPPESADAVERAVVSALTEEAPADSVEQRSLYGGGKAAERIVDCLLETVAG